MRKPKAPGNINCYISSTAKFGNISFSFNGTTLDLVKQSIKIGAKEGDTIHANYGGGFRPQRIYAAPHDLRAGGFWVE